MADRNILLVEGTDDEHVVKHLCARHGLPEIDEIAKLGGISRLTRSLPVRVKESGVAALGVLVDADTDLLARWESLRTHLVAAEYPSVPVSPDADGTIILPPKNALLPKVGIWLMPDNRTNGILEDFLRFLVPSPDLLLEHAQQSIAGIPVGHRRFASKDEAKALLHTWLAWQQEPGKPFGTAITARYLDANVPHVASFVAWLKRLFFS